MARLSKELMLIYIAACVTIGVLLLLAIFGALTNILAVLRELVNVTRTTPILTQSSRYRQ